MGALIAMRKSNTSLALIPALATAAAVWCAAMAAPALAADDLQLADNAPDRYIVVQGDTLWGISGKFLKDPWRWPELWHMNQEQIRTPNKIYPGNIIVLDRSKGQPQLKLAIPITAEKLDPKARVEKLGSDVPSIAPGLIEPFLSQPLVVDENGLERAPRIVSTQEDRVYMGAGTRAYVVGMEDKTKTLWQVYRPGKALIDPDTRAVLGHEAIFLGSARVVREGEPTTIELVSTTQEVGRGDRLVPASKATPLSYVPHAPENFVKGRVVSIYGDLAESGPNSIIAINRGLRDGMEIGNVLALYRYGKYFDDVTPVKELPPTPAGTPPESATPYGGRTGGNKVRLKLPDERYGLIFVFRVFDKISYALVLSVTRPVNVEDVVQSP
jgi:hypothetical protein